MGRVTLYGINEKKYIKLWNIVKNKLRTLNKIKKIHNQIKMTENFATENSFYIHNRKIWKWVSNYKTTSDNNYKITCNIIQCYFPVQIYKKIIKINFFFLLYKFDNG